MLRACACSSVIPRRSHASGPTLAFEDAARVLLDIAAGAVEVAEVEHALAGDEQRRDLGAQEPRAGLPGRARDRAYVLAGDTFQNARRGP
jgi:hypothetical protein